MTSDYVDEYVEELYYKSKDLIAQLNHLVVLLGEFTELLEEEEE